MPITNYPFGIPEGFRLKKPALPIILYNPANDPADEFEYRTIALIDTGADITIIPEYIAKALNHNIRHPDVETIYSWGIGGDTKVYLHTFSMDVLYVDAHGTIGDKVVIQIPPTKFHVVAGLGTVVLGENDFLNKYILSIHYPKQIFSVKNP